MIEERGKNKIGDQYGISVQNKSGMMRDSVNAIKNKSQYTAENKKTKVVFRAYQPSNFSRLGRMRVHTESGLSSFPRATTEILSRFGDSAERNTPIAFMGSPFPHENRSIPMK